MTQSKFKIEIFFSKTDRPVGNTFDEEFNLVKRPLVNILTLELFKRTEVNFKDCNELLSAIYNVSTTNKGTQYLKVEAKPNRDSNFGTSYEIDITDPTDKLLTIKTETYPDVQYRNLVKVVEDSDVLKEPKSTAQENLTLFEAAAVTENSSPKKKSKEIVMAPIDPMTKELKDILEDFNSEAATIAKVTGISYIVISDILDGTFVCPEKVYVSLKNVLNCFSPDSFKSTVPSTNSAEFAAEVKEVVKPVTEEYTENERLIKACCDRINKLMKIADFGSSSETGISPSLYPVLNSAAMLDFKFQLDTYMSVEKKLKENVLAKNSTSEKDKELKESLMKKINDSLEKYFRDDTQANIARYLNIRPGIVSIIKRRAIREIAVPKLEYILKNAEKVGKDKVNKEAKDTLKKAKIAEEKAIAKELMPNEKPGNGDVNRSRLYSTVLALGNDCEVISKATSIDKSKIALILSRSLHSFSDSEVSEMLSLCNEAKENGPIDKPKVLKDLADLKTLIEPKSQKMHPKGVMFEKQFDKSYIKEAEKRFANNFHGHQTKKDLTINRTYAESNKDSLTAISNNAVTISNLTGIPMNMVIKAMNYENKSGGRETLAIHLYLSDISETIEELKSKV